MTGRISNPYMLVEPPKHAASNGKHKAASKAETAVVEVTPEMARRWLEGNNKNRRPSMATVDRYASDMRSGRWMLTHQGIAFSANGLLLDGQHRLLALVKADVPVLMNVTHGVDADAMLAIDQNRTRRSFEQFTLMGSLGAVGKGHTSTLKAMYYGLAGSDRLSMANEYELLDFYKEAVDFAIALTPKNIRNITTSPVRGAIARAYYVDEHEKVATFAKSLTSGVCTVENGGTIALLARWLISGNVARGGDSARMEIYGKTTRCLHAFIHGERLNKLYVPTQELFVIPKFERKH